MALASRAVVEKITEVVERIADPAGIEIVEVDLLGGGASRVLRIIIDKPDGVTHGDCETISRNLGETLDERDIIPGGSYTLEVTSPGIERKLTKPKDFDRFVGNRIKVSLKQVVDGEKRFDGVLEAFENGVATVAIRQGKTKEPKRVSFEFGLIEKANLRHEW